MFKKILAVAMATAMVFSVAQIAPANTTSVEAADVTVGSTDRTTKWWTAFSDHYQLDDGKTVTIEFENHGFGAADVWNNYLYVLHNEADMSTDTRSENYKEYAVVRADNWGWAYPNVGDNVAADGTAIQYEMSMEAGAEGTDWGDITKDSKVVSTFTRSKNLVQIDSTVTSLSDATKSYTRKIIISTDATAPVFVTLTCENTYLVIKDVKTGTISEEQKNQLDNTQTTKVDPPTTTTKKTLTLMESAATTSKVTGELTVAPGKVTVKAGSKTFTGTVKGKTFTVKLSGVKAGTKLTLTIEKDGYSTLTKTLTAKGTMKLSKVKTKKNTKKITGTVSQKKATVKIKVGKKKYKKAKVSGKKFTLKCAKLKKGTKVTIKVTKKNYKTLTKSYKVK